MCKNRPMEEKKKQTKEKKGGRFYSQAARTLLKLAQDLTKCILVLADQDQLHRNAKQR